MATSSIIAAMRKAGATALRDMKAEARKRVRARKAIKAGKIGRALVLQRPAKLVPGVTSQWALRIKGGTTHVSDYSYRQTRVGVSAVINRGKRSAIRSAFVATMPTGHRGVFERVPGKYIVGRKQNKHGEAIREPLASRIVDALLHPGEAQAIAERGARSFVDTFGRLATTSAVQELPALRHRIE